MPMNQLNCLRTLAPGLYAVVQSDGQLKMTNVCWNNAYNVWLHPTSKPYSLYGRVRFVSHVTWKTMFSFSRTSARQ